MRLAPFHVPLFITVAAVGALVACKKEDAAAPGTPAAAKPAESPPAGPRVGLVFDVGGRGDKSFNDSADRGLQRAQRELGASTQVVEPGAGADREASLRQLAARKTDVIFGVGFLFTEDITRLAQEFPQQRFACVDYTVTPGKTVPDNLLAIRFKEEEGSYLVGALAALKSASPQLGFVGGMDIPLIRRFQAGFTAGVKAVRPEASIISVFAGVTGEGFTNPGKGKELGLSLYGKGVDIIFHAAGSTGLGVFEAGRAQKKLAIGVDSDQYAEAPGVVLTSMVKRVDVAVFEVIKAVKEGTFKGGVREFDLKSGGVDYVYDEHNKALIPDEVHARVEALRADIVSGKVVVPNQ
jgi:basic membrane protein A